MSTPVSTGAEKADPATDRAGALEHRALVEITPARDVDSARALMGEHLGGNARRFGAARA